MKISKFLLFILILPVTIILDFLLFSSGLKCPSCDSFWPWLYSESSLSFPILATLSGAFSILGSQMFKKIKR